MTLAIWTDRRGVHDLKYLHVNFWISGMYMKLLGYINVKIKSVIKRKDIDNEVFCKNVKPLIYSWCTSVAINWLCKTFNSVFEWNYIRFNIYDLNIIEQYYINIYTYIYRKIICMYMYITWRWHSLYVNSNNIRGTWD